MEISIEYRFRTLSEFRTMMFVEVFDMFINGKPMGFKYVKDTDRLHEPSVLFDVYTNKLDNEPLDIDGIHFTPVEYGYCCHSEQEVRILYKYITDNNLLPEEAIYMDRMLNGIISDAKELSDLYQCVDSNGKLQSWSQKAVKLMENLQLYKLWHDTCK